MAILNRIIQPLRSRKVRVGIATVIAAYLAEAGVGVSEHLVLTILGAGVAIILGIAVEDHASKGGQARKQAARIARNDQ